MENQQVNQTNPSNNQVATSDQQVTGEQVTTKKSNSLLVPMLLVLILVLMGSTGFFAYHYFQQKELATNIIQDEVTLETPPTTQKPTEKPVFKLAWQDYSVDLQKNSFDANLSESAHYLSPSILNSLNGATYLPYSCLEINGQIPLQQVQESIENNTLREGIDQISNYTFTKPVQTEDGTPLPPIKSKYEIDFSSICKITEDSFITIFITTQAKTDSLSLIPQAHAAGGWLGGSHMAIIDSDGVEIFERFPFEAELINLPLEEEEPVLLRFGAYYNCKEIIAVTQNNVLIDCNRNVYSFNRQTENFKEMSICGSYIDNNSYMTNRFTCFDTSGEIYSDKDNSST